MENRDYSAPEEGYTSPEQNYENTYNTQYSSQPYGNGQYANMGGTPVDGYGVPLKNRFAVQLVFAIIEIICCCLSPLAMVFGIIALIFAIQANSAYNLGRGEEFKAKSKTTNILLIIGGVFMAISILINAVVIALLPQILEESYSYLEEYNYGDLDELEEFFRDEDSDFYEEYSGPNDIPLADNCNQFVLNGVDYQLPMTYTEFSQMGYEVEDLEAGYVFTAETFDYFSLIDEDGRWIGSIRISNDTQTDLPAEECVIDYVDFWNDAVYDAEVAPLDFKFGNGLDINATYEELKAWLGEPYYVSEETVDGSMNENYTWVYDGEDRYQCVDVYFLDGKITRLSVEQYDVVY